MGKSIILFFANASKGIVSIKTIIKLNIYNKIFYIFTKEESLGKQNTSIN